jgi:acetyl esterase
LDYRIAPENPFPAAWDDAWYALRWLADHGTSLGLDILLAECVLVVDDGIAYADRLRMAGVAVDLEVYRGVTHDFMKMGRLLPEASQALDAAAQALQLAWKGTPPT